MAGQHLNLLCIDGGGVKGLSALIIIGKLMELINPDNPPRPCDHFDVIGGTSTGGLIAIMLGRLEMTVDECVLAFHSLQSSIFHKVHRLPVNIRGAIQSRYDHAALERGVKDLLRSRGLDEDTLFRNPEDSACKVFVTATRKDTSTTEILASYRRRRGPSEIYNTAKIWEVARATSAATTFFDCITIGSSGRQYLDGGTGANNPAFKMWEEATDLFCKDQSLEDGLNCFISVGCGLPSLHQIGNNATDLLQALVRISTETESTAERFRRDKDAVFQDHRCFRFNAPSAGDIGMDEPEESARISQITDNYIEQQDIHLQMMLCSKRLLEREIPCRALGFLNTQQRALIRAGQWSRNFVSYYDVSQRQVYDIFDRISQYDAARTYERLSKGKYPGTTNWLLQTAPFRKWLEEPVGSCFVLAGIVGSGKTTCSTTVVDFLCNAAAADYRDVFHFFYEFGYSNRLTGLDVLEAFIKQIILTKPELPADLRDRVWNYYGPHSGRPDISELGTELFQPLVRRHLVKNAIFVIDGLDECDAKSRLEVIQILSPLLQEGQLLFTSIRDESEIRSVIPDLITVECSTNEPGLRHDLEIFVSSLTDQHIALRRITDKEEVMTHIKTTLLAKANAMFLWAKLLVIEVWDNCNNDEEIEDYLENRLPRSLQETYSRCIARVHPSKAELSKDLFRLVCGAVEPFYMEELRDILTLKAVNEELVSVQDKPSTDILMKDCAANLITADKDGLVLPIHHSVRQHVFPSQPQSYWPQSHESRTSIQGKLEVERNIGYICMLCILQSMERSLVLSSAASHPKLPSGTTVMPFQPFKLLTKLKGNRNSKPVTRILWSTAASNINLRDNQALLSYAQRTWVQANRSSHFAADETSASRRWALFHKLASEHRSGVIYPWSKFATSHLHGLFTWAVTHGHLPLLDIVLTPPCSQKAMKMDLYNKPLLPPYQGIALHYAARTCNVPLFMLLWEHSNSNVWTTDVDGNTALHIGALLGCTQITDVYMRSISFPRAPPKLVVDDPTYCKRYLENNEKQNPLHMAMKGGNIECVAHVVFLATKLNEVDRRSARTTWQDHDFLKWDSTKDNDCNTPFDLAVAVRDDEFLVACVRWWINQGLHRMTVLKHVTRTAFSVHKWTLCNWLLHQTMLTTDYPFSEADDITKTNDIPSSLVGIIIDRKPSWIPRLLADSWRSGHMAWRDALLVFPVDEAGSLSRNDHVRLLGFCQSISHGRLDHAQYERGQIYQGMVDSTDWPSIIFAEALAVEGMEGVEIALSKAMTLHSFVMNELVRTRNKDLRHFVKDVRSRTVFDDECRPSMIPRDRWSGAAAEAAERGDVPAFLARRHSKQLAIISSGWLRGIACHEQIPSPVRMRLLPALDETSSVPDGVLWYAGLNGYKDVAALMLDQYSANINYRGEHDTSPLWQAAFRGHWEAVELLLSRGADAALKNTEVKNQFTAVVRIRSMNAYEAAEDQYGSEIPERTRKALIASLDQARCRGSDP